MEEEEVRDHHTLKVNERFSMSNTAQKQGKQPEKAAHSGHIIQSAALLKTVEINWKKYE